MVEKYGTQFFRYTSPRAEFIAEHAAEIIKCIVADRVGRHISSNLTPNQTPPGFKVNNPTTSELKPLGLGSTGRSVASNLNEQVAIQEIMSNPEMGKVLDNIKLNDSRWPHADGWRKMEWQSKGAVMKNFETNKPTAHIDPLGNTNIEIHYVGKWINDKLVAIDDFKFKN